ncbi:hypothetical protein GCM10007415_04400 [Parapedobacter pyrenivorans]|uniref:Uncharacterized protein n=1 Tax=Parapedobacter pyrenivorans TaxID=1305674 RepID=A0A917HDM9_9SPHI|nr:hypothetical protein [Parapedobacter pyrenivorans]GGG75879.1 hypothetical protein GCM10007415_04400 [Parapedobacter pyrenivorans]
MLKRDSLTAQMQQLSHTLAKVKRLIVEEQKGEALSVLKEVLGEYFGTTITDLLETPANLFRQHLDSVGFQPEELGLLADFLDTLADLSELGPEKTGIWEKVLLIYDALEQTHKVVSFTHIARRGEILSMLGNGPS